MEGLARKARFDSREEKFSMRKNTTFERIDKSMALIILLLVCYGTVMVFTASYPYALSTHGDSFYYVKRQIFWVLIGLVGMTVCAALPSEFHKKYTAPIGFIVSVGCLIAVLFSASSVKRWLNIGIINIQPSEIMKPMIVMILALYMQHFHDKISRDGISRKQKFLLGGKVTNRKLFLRASTFSTFIPIAIIAAVCTLIMLENHFSGTIITFTIGAIVVFAGGAMLRWFVGAGAVALSGVFVVLFGTDYASERISIWLHPERYSVRDETWQITQGLIAIGSGGWFGEGLGAGVQKHLYVSAAHNDFIFSIVCEELGLVGALVAIALFCIFIHRGITLAMRSTDLFSNLVIVGIVAHVGLQAFLNIAVVTGTIPNTGVTLPFFSYGGSALVVLLCENGILLSCSKNSRV